MGVTGTSLSLVHICLISSPPYCITMDRTSLIILISCVIFLVMMILLVFRIPCIMTINRPCCCSKDEDDVVSLLKQDGVIRLLAQAAEEGRCEDVRLSRSESGYCSNSSSTSNKVSRVSFTV